MTDSPADDARLRATELQMRRALGLQGDTPPRSEDDPLPSQTTGAHRLPRRFVRDGDVPVTVVRRDHHSDDTGTNQLEVARQAVRAETAARQHAERLLGEAQTAIRDLQTKLAHERLAKDELLHAVRRAETDKQTAVQAHLTVEAELSAARQAQQKVEDAFAETRRGRSTSAGRRRVAGVGDNAQADQHEPASRIIGQAVRKPRKAGKSAGESTAVPRQPADDDEQEPIKWWVKGWQKDWR